MSHYRGTACELLQRGMPYDLLQRHGIRVITEGRHVSYYNKGCRMSRRRQKARYGDDKGTSNNGYVIEGYIGMAYIVTVHMVRG